MELHQQLLTPKCYNAKCCSVYKSEILSEIRLVDVVTSLSTV